MREKQLTSIAISSCQKIAGVLLLLAACGGAGSDSGVDGSVASVDGAPGAPDAEVGPPDAGPVTASALCDQLTSILCAAEQACCTDSSRRYADQTTCEAAQKPACMTDLAAPASDGRTGYDAAIARAELDELAAMAASCDASIGPWFVSHDGLLRVYQGTVGSGGDCTPADQSDTAPVLSCESPNVCRLQAFPLSGSCGAPRQSGDSCVTEIECADGLRCNPPESLSGRCTTRLANGMSCTDNGDCSSLICRGGSCLPATVDNVYCFDVD